MKTQEIEIDKQAATGRKWHIERPFQEPGIYIAAENSALVCKVSESYDNAEANARLIASAPELLAALKSAVESLEDARETILDIDPDEWMRAKPLSERIEELLSAIAKAEGRAL